MLPIPRLAGPVRRTWQVPGSKSITNRALLLAALGEGTSVIENVLDTLEIFTDDCESVTGTRDRAKTEAAKPVVARLN